MLCAGRRAAGAMYLNQTSDKSDGTGKHARLGIMRPAAASCEPERRARARESWRRLTGRLCGSISSLRLSSRSPGRSRRFVALADLAALTVTVRRPRVRLRVLAPKPLSQTVTSDSESDVHVQDFCQQTTRVTEVIP